MPEIDRLNQDTSWIDLEFVKREQTPEQIIEVGIQLHLIGLSLSNTKQYLERLGVERSRTAIHTWVKKADLQPDSDVSPNQIAVDETMIQVNDEQHWLYAAVDPGTKQILHTRLFQTRTTQLTVLFLRELREKPDRTGRLSRRRSGSLIAALERLTLRFQVIRHGNRNSVEHIFRKVKRRTSSFSNTFSNTATDLWLQAFAVWWNRCQN